MNEERNSAKNIDDIINNSYIIDSKRSPLRPRRSNIANNLIDQQFNERFQEKSITEEKSNLFLTKTIISPKKESQESANYLNDEEYIFNQDEIIEQIINDNIDKNQKNEILGKNGNNETSIKNFNNKFITVIINNNKITNNNVLNLNINDQNGNDLLKNNRDSTIFKNTGKFTA